MSAYKIVFEPQGAFWCIELQKLWGLTWSRVRTNVLPDAFTDPKTSASTGKTVKTFPTYAEARAYVQQIGLDNAYADRTGPAPGLSMDHRDTQGYLRPPQGYQRAVQ